MKEFEFEQPIAYKMLNTSINNNRLANAYLIEDNGSKQGLKLACSFCEAILNTKLDLTANAIIINPNGVWIKREQIDEIKDKFSTKAIIGKNKVYIINDASNVERAYKLLVANGLLTSYSVEGFNAQHPVYESAIGVTIECIDAGLLHQKVSEGGYAVIPGNYALTAWGATKAAEYKVFGESTDVAYPNIIAVRTEDLQSEKIKVLVEALSQPEVKKFIEETYGPTVNYVYESLLK